MNAEPTAVGLPALQELAYSRDEVTDVAPQPLSWRYACRSAARLALLGFLVAMMVGAAGWLAYRLPTTAVVSAPATTSIAPPGTSDSPMPPDIHTLPVNPVALHMFTADERFVYLVSHGPDEMTVTAPIADLGHYLCWWLDTHTTAQTEASEETQTLGDGKQITHSEAVTIVTAAEIAYCPWYQGK